MSILQAAALLGAFFTSVAAHGHVQGIVADGVYYEGYNPSFQYMSTPPAVIGWSCPECLDNGFVTPDAYGGSNITCHKNATPGQAHATVAAGGTVELQWTAWPESHHGPVIDYLAKCSEECETVDKDTLEFFKVDQGGLVDDSTVPGTWASDKLIANNNSWTVKIPSSIAPGNYVLRHEIIALHSAGNADGAQNYPQCINLQVTGSGSDTPSGILGTALYKETDPGILINIYTSLSTYDTPGPTLYNGAESVSQTAVSTTATAFASSIASATSTVVTSTLAATSAASSAVVSSSIVSGAPVSTPAALSVQASSVAAVAASSSSAVTSSASEGEVTSYVTDDATTTTTAEVYVTVSGPAPTSASEVAPIVSVITNLPSMIPSSLLASTLPTAIPTGADNSSGNLPSTPLPAGMTLKELLEWVSYIMSTFFRHGGGKHPRDLSSVHEQKRQSNHLSGSPSGGFAAPSGSRPSGIVSGVSPMGTGLHHHQHSHRPHGTGLAFGTGAHSLPAETGAPFPTTLPSVGDKAPAASSGAPFSTPYGGFARPSGRPHGPHGGEFGFGTGFPSGFPVPTKFPSGFPVPTALPSGLSLPSVFSAPTALTSGL